METQLDIPLKSSPKNGDLNESPYFLGKMTSRKHVYIILTHLNPTFIE